MADIALICPKFHPTYWGFDYALPLFRKGALMPPLNLALLAALTPAGHTVTIIDENVEPIDYERCRRADIVGVTGMAVQRVRMREVLTELKCGAFSPSGGPWVTVKPDGFDSLADAVFIGEAEETWPRSWPNGPRAVTGAATSSPIKAICPQCRRRGSICSRWGNTSTAACKFRAAARSPASSAISSWCSAAGRGSRAPAKSLRSWKGCAPPECTTRSSSTTI